MNDFAKKIGAPALPSVNLIPKDIAEKRAMRAVQFTALMAVVIAVGVVVVGYLGALGAKGLAERELTSARSGQEAAITQRDGMSDVYYAYVDREIEEYTLAQIGFGHVNYEQLATAILATANEDINFDDLRFQLPSAFGYAGVISDPVFGGGVGSFEFQVRTDSAEAATEFLARMEQVPGVANVYGTVEAFFEDGDSGAYWQVSGQAVITELWLADQLLPEGAISGIEGIDIFRVGDEAQTAPVPEPTATPSPEGEEQD